MIYLSLSLIIVVKYSIKQNSKKGQVKSKGGKLDYQGIENAQATRGSQSDNRREDVVLILRRSVLTATQLGFCVSTGAKDLLQNVTLWAAPGWWHSDIRFKE